MKKIYFVSSNQEKYKEVKKLGETDGIKIEFWEKTIPELQTSDEKELIEAKVIAAFKEIKRPVLVEHTLLELEAFSGLPGVHTSYFYDKIGFSKIVNYCNSQKDFRARAKSIFGFTDGKKIYSGEKVIKGTIVSSVEGIDQTEGFAWDVIFIPNEDNPDRKTFAKLGIQKQFRKEAWDELKRSIAKCWDDILDDKKEKDLEEQYMEELAKLIRERKLMLFIGAGISASVKKFPLWNELIGELGKSVGYDEKIFSQHGDNMMLAEYIGIQDADCMYDELKKRLELGDDVKDRLESSEIYKAISELNVPVIYTTNYDELLEKGLRIHGEKEENISKVVTIKDVPKTGEGMARIMKFHGDIGDSRTIVLTESQYYERMNFQSFMDIQLQADMLKYSILFLGYSMSDINIKLLLYLAKKRWEGIDNDLKSYIYTATPNPIQKEVFEKNGIFTICGETADKKKGTEEFLGKLVDMVKTGNSGEVESAVGTD